MTNSTVQSAIAPETIEARQIFLKELLPMLVPGRSAEELKAVQHCHSLWLDWERDPTKQSWNKFIKHWRKIEA